MFCIEPNATTAQLTFAGDPGLAGSVTTMQVTCNFPNPTADGSVLIALLAQPSDPTVLFNMKVSKGNISVGVFSGSGTASRGRSFQGTGVKGFNAAKGATIDSKLTETTNTGENPGTLGAITSIKGSIACGNQTKGASTVTFTGSTAEGKARGAARPFLVQCNSSASVGNSVAFVGIVKVGKTKALFFAAFTASSLTVSESFPGPPPSQHRYVGNAGVATLTATGAKVAGDVVEQSSTNGAPHALHLKGNVTCGATIRR